VTQDKKPVPAVAEAPVTRPPLTTGFQLVGLIPITVRLRQKIAGALKRASLERQLAGSEFFSQQEIVERALAAWLRENGHGNE